MRLSSGRVTPEVVRAFRAWLAASPDHEAAWQWLQAVWEDIAPLWATLKPGPPPSRLHRGRWGAAAAFALALAGALLIFPPSGWWADYTTGVGEQRLVTLPDGSTVQLNTRTALALRYSAPIRGVEVLSGEAAGAERTVLWLRLRAKGELAMDRSRTSRNPTFTWCARSIA